MYYHGAANSELTATDFASFDYVCLTDREEIAEAYAQSWCSEAVYEIVVLDGPTASETELYQIAEELGVEAESTYELADDYDVREALAQAGYDYVEYEDMTDTGRSHTTLLTLRAGLISHAVMA